MQLQENTTVDMLILGDEAFEAKMRSDEIATNKAYQPEKGPYGPVITGPMGTLARLYHGERDASTPLLVLTQNDPAFEECYPMPFIPLMAKRSTVFAQGTELSRFSEMCKILVDSQNYFGQLISAEIDAPHTFAYPKEFYNVLDIQYFNAISSFLKAASVGMMIKKGTFGTYAVLCMELNTDDPEEAPQVIFATITLK